MSNTTGATPRKKNPFDEGSVLRSPDRACIGRVAAIGEGKPRNEGRTISWPITIETIGAVPGGKANAWFEIAPIFLDKNFKRDEFVNSNEDGAFYDKVFEDNLTARKPADGERRGIPALLGLCGCDTDRFYEAGTALKAAYEATPDKSFDALEPVLREALASGLTGNEVGFWQCQGVKFAGTDAEGNNIWEVSPWFNIKAPKYVNSPWFKPNAEGRARVLDKCRNSKTNAQTGQPYVVATFDEATAF